MKMDVLLVGDGVKKRASLLQESLDALGSDWRIRLDEGLSSAEGVTAAIGMPKALVWRKAIPHLKFLQLPGAGLDGLTAQDVPEDCRVCNVYEHEASIVEYILNGMLHFHSSWFMQSVQALRLGQWPYLDRIGEPTRPSICGKRLGIVGFGHMGQRLTDAALALNMRVKVFTKSGADRPERKSYQQRGVEFVPDLAQIAGDADFFVVACLSNSETKGLIDGKILQQLPPSCIFINTARSEIVVEEDLYQFLSGRKIAGALLDVWYQYPSSAGQRLQGSRFPFEKLDCVMMTPHLAANTDDMLLRRWSFMAQNLHRFLRGEKLENVVKLS